MISGRNSQVFTADDTFIVPEDVYCLYITQVGGGGAGTAGFNSTHAGNGLCGGGAGAFCTKVPVPVIPGEAVPIVVGTAGSPAFTGSGGDTATHRYGQVNEINIGGNAGGGFSKVKNIQVDGGQTAFWGISFGHPWAGSGAGGGGSCGFITGGPSVPGSMAGQTFAPANGLSLKSGYGSHRYWGGSSGGAFNPVSSTRNGFNGGGAPGSLGAGGDGGAGYPFDGTNFGNAGGGGGASLWGNGGNGGTSNVSVDTSFHHNAANDADSPSSTAYGAAGGGGATYDSAYGLGASGADGYVMVSW